MPVRDLLLSATSAAPATYVEDVFSTYLYTGTGSFQNVPTGIDLDSKGGMLWIKSRSASTNNVVFDTARGLGSTGQLITNSSAAATDSSSAVVNLGSTGFGLYGGGTQANVSGNTYCSWTFRKQPKFFDVVTYTGDGTGSHTIAHNLGSTPAMIIVKNTTTASFGDWNVWHKNLPAQSYSLYLNTTGAAFSSGLFISQNSTSFTVGYDRNNESGVTYVAYLFASNAGGFGTAGTDNVITCGGYTGTGSSNISINLGYEPQYILIKNSSSSSNYWYVQDVMRGMSYTSSNILYPNRSDLESVAASSIFIPTATGFDTSSSAGFNASGNNYIYMAIRRPMKVPTDATTVFSPIAYTGTGANQNITSGFAPDMVQFDIRGSDNGYQKGFADKLRNAWSIPTNTDAEYGPLSTGNVLPIFNNTGFVVGAGNNANGSGSTYVSYAFARRPGFFDEVCYTGTGSATTQTHNLGVVPELMIVKSRSNSSWAWAVYCNKLNGGVTPEGYGLSLNITDAAFSIPWWNYTAPTSTLFNLYASATVNQNNGTFVAYLFATCPGVSKVGSYTGNGTTQAIACGFTGGARFVLIKRTDSTGDWFVYDTARGMTTLIDPYLLLNSTAAESATLGSVTTTTGGFTVNASILAAINTSGASYIFLAIA